MRVSLVLFVVALSWASCLAATAGRQTAQPIIPPAPGGKSSSTRVAHQAFANAGSKAGVEVWRIEVSLIKI